MEAPDACALSPRSRPGRRSLLCSRSGSASASAGETTTRPLAAINVRVHRGHSLDTVCLILALCLIALVLVRGALLTVEIAARGDWEDRGLLARTRSTLLGPQTVALDPDRSSRSGRTGS